MGGGVPKMSDPKAPTYEDRPPVGRAFMVRHFSRSDICKGQWSMCHVSDLKAPTYEDHGIGVA
jgi:hypothetical protein